MVISEIKIKNFKKFANAKFVFDNGINVIKGPNEQGKSTLLRAIIASLYIDPASKKYQDDYKSWNSGTLPELECDFFEGDALYAIIKDFNTKTTILKDVIHQQEEKNYATIVDTIKSITGIGNESLLRTTACIYHDDIAFIDSGRKSLQDGLREVALQDGKVNTTDLIKALDDKITQMQVGLFHPAKNNGILKRLQDEIAEKKESLTKLKNSHATVASSGTKLQSLEQELKEVESQIEKYTKVVTDYDQKDVIQRDVTILQEKISRITLDLDKVKEVQEKITVNEEKLMKLGGQEVFDTMESSKERITLLSQQITKQQEEISAYVPPKEDVVVEKQSILPKLLLVASIGSLVFVLIGLVTTLALVFVGLAMSGIAFILFLLAQKEKSHTEEEIVAPNPLEEMQKNLEELMAQLHALLEVCSVGSIDEYFTKRTQFIALQADAMQMKEVVHALLRGAHYEELDKELKEAIVAKKEKETLMPQTETVSKDQYLRDKRELELLQLDKKDIVQEITEEKTKIKVVDVSEDDVKLLEDKIQSLEAEFDEKNKHVEVLKGIKEGIDGALKHISAAIAKDLETYATKNMEMLTDGRYTGIKMNEVFDIEVFSKDKNDWVSPHKSLSKGTIDQIYIALRIALADIITGGKSIPLFFDDPFVSFDEKRRNILMGELQDIAQKRQVFIFTCHDFFDNYGKVINVKDVDVVE